MTVLTGWYDRHDRLVGFGLDWPQGFSTSLGQQADCTSADLLSHQKLESPDSHCRLQANHGLRNKTLKQVAVDLNTLFDFMQL